MPYLLNCFACAGIAAIDDVSSGAIVDLSTSIFLRL
jgi:hypothetical protein